MLRRLAILLAIGAISAATPATATAPANEIDSQAISVDEVERVDAPAYANEEFYEIEF